MTGTAGLARAHRSNPPLRWRACAHRLAHPLGRTGPRGSALHEAGPWFPAVLLLEMGIVATDMVAARALLGEAMGSIPGVTWVRSAMLAYASTVVLPAGRAAGEAVRTTTLAPAIGFGRATGVCSRLQACVLASNAGISFVIAAVVFSRPRAKGSRLRCSATRSGSRPFVRRLRCSAKRARRAVAQEAFRPLGPIARRRPYRLRGRGGRSRGRGVPPRTLHRSNPVRDRASRDRRTGDPLHPP